MTAKRDLLIHYDEIEQKFIFYSVDASESARLRAGAFDGVCPEVSFFKEKTPDEAEQAFGGMALALLDLGSINKANIRNYQAESAAAMQQWADELDGSVQNNDAEAQYNLHMVYHSRAMKSGLASDLQRAEDLLFASANAGYPRAIATMENWPVMKAAAKKRTQRDPSV